MCGIIIKRSYKLLIVVICALGLSLQMNQVSRLYFKYMTSTEVTVSPPIVMSSPRVSFCWRYIDILLIDKLRQKNWTNYQWHARGEDEDEGCCRDNQTIKEPLGMIDWNEVDWDAIRPYDTTSNLYKIIENNLTLREIFDMTPASYDIFGNSSELRRTHSRMLGNPGCIIREPERFTKRYHLLDHCKLLFKVEKYFHREFICYKMKLIPRSDRLYQYHKLKNVTTYIDNYSKENLSVDALPGSEKPYEIQKTSFTKHWFGLFYSIFFNGKLFRDGQYFTVIVHEANSSNLYDSALTTLMWRSIGRPKFSENSTKHGSSVLKNTSTDGDTGYKYFGARELQKDGANEEEERPFENIRVSYYGNHMERLPPPYDTNCLSFPPFRSFYEYIFNCTNNLTIERYNLVTPLGMTFEGTDTKHAQIFPFIDERALENMKNTIDFCSKNRTIVSNCKFDFTVTRSSSYQSTDLSVSIHWPQDSITTIKHVARMELIEFILYLSSSIGTWFGLSYLSSFMKLYGLVTGDGATFFKADGLTNKTTSGADHNYVTLVYMKKDLKQIRDRLEIEQLKSLKLLEMKLIEMIRNRDCVLSKRIKDLRYDLSM